jgi:hypothetical protein
MIVSKFDEIVEVILYGEVVYVPRDRPNQAGLRA